MPQQFSEAYPRFIAKVKDAKKPKVFYVYDRARASYPVLVPDFGRVKEAGTEEEMVAEAHRLGAFTDGATP